MFEHLINKENIYLIKERLSQKDLFRFIINNMVKLDYASIEYLDEIINRENEYPTAIQIGAKSVAMPHTDTNNINKSSIQIAQLKHPIIWGNMDGSGSFTDVSLVFLLALTKDQNHMDVLMKVLNIIQDPVLLDKLHDANDKETIKKLILEEGR